MISRDPAVANIGTEVQKIQSVVQKTTYMNVSPYSSTTTFTGSLSLPTQEGFWAKLGTGQTYSYNGATVLAFNDVRYNIGSCYNPSNGRFTVPATGVYVISAGGMQEASGNGWLGIEFYRNGVVDYNLPATSNTTTGWVEHGICISSTVRLIYGDYIQFALYKSYAGALGNSGGSSDWGEARNFFSIQRIS